ncbi:MAG: PDZ domain-containing protein [Bacteroidetes bacterium]|nr:PDZ domain-containing protein [Bacteroidota bacterium]
MIHYSVKCPNPAAKYLSIETKAKTLGNPTIQIQIAAWRPGRYELQNYAQNIRGFGVWDVDGNPIPHKSINKDLWEVEVGYTQEIIIKYQYYANQLDAGASYVDDTQWYINPINCLVYFPDRIDENCALQINIPANYSIASSLEFDKNNTALASNFHELADSPLIAAAELLHETYQIKNTLFHLWIKGNANPDWRKIKEDFAAFSEVQINLFGDFPVAEYHFLFQLPDYKHYHGVEHLASTVICLGPGYNLMEISTYNDFLGISSHELFHAWNVKSIRPIEMFPYDYTKENYSNLGYVAEGVTTYYGDLMLLRAGVYPFEEYAKEVDSFLQRYYHNYGWQYMSLADSSHSTWLDGYKPTTAPDRRTNMYVKGLLVAFIMDIEIRKDTQNTKSMDDVLRSLYHDFAKQKKGYSEADYLTIINKISGKDYTQLFNKYVWGLDEIDTALAVAMEYIGCDIIQQPATKTCERIYGFKCGENGKTIITAIAPNSPADVARLSVGDEIVAINQIQTDNNNLEDVLRFGSDAEIELSFFRGKRLLKVKMQGNNDTYYPNRIMRKLKNLSEFQKDNFNKWSENN